MMRRADVCERKHGGDLFSQAAFEQVVFQVGTRQLDKRDPGLTHHTDALRYYVSTEWPAKKRAAGGVTPAGW